MAFALTTSLSVNVHAQCTGTSTVVHSTDFEAGASGWIPQATASGAINEWEVGSIVLSGNAGCDAPSGSANSGSSVFGTDLDGCYDNANTQYVLSQTFSLAGLSAPINLSWYELVDANGSNFDYAQVIVNGTVLYDSNVSGDVMAWTQQTVNLDAYAGQSVTVEFSFNTTSVADGPGWFIDDVLIEACTGGTSTSCPTLVSVTANPSACDGDMLNFTAVTTGSGSATITVSGLSGSVVLSSTGGGSYSGSQLVGNDGCNGVNYVYTYSAVCSDGSSIGSGSFSSAVYPSDISAFFSTSANGCLTYLNVDPVCDLSAYSITPAFSQSANAGDGVGVHTYNVSALSGCVASISLTEAYDCPGTSTDADLSQFVWLDAGGDGIFDAGETPIGGVTVFLYDASGNVVATTVSNADGSYNFYGVAAGNYTVGSSYNGQTFNSTIFTLFSGSNSPLNAGHPYLDSSTCSSSAGVMPQGIQIGCWGETVSIGTSGASVNAGDVLAYVLHDGTFTNIYGWSMSGLFTNDGTVPQNVYPELVVSAVAGPPAANGYPDLTDVCTSTSNGTPVRFLSEINITAEFTCNQTAGTYDVVFSINGGYPDFPNGNNAFYQVTGDWAGQATAGTVYTIAGIPDGSTYTISVTNDQKGCAAVWSETVECTKTPVTLLHYTGEVQNDGNLLKWSTASETINDYFTLESSVDGITFDFLANVDGSGTTTDLSTYDFLDRDAASGTSYYRLSQTDFDGTFEYLGIIALDRGETALEISSISPVPALHNVEILFDYNANTEISISVIDAIGRTAMSEIFTAQNGINTADLNVSDLSGGVYFIHITDGAHTMTKKFIKE